MIREIRRIGLERLIREQRRFYQGKKIDEIRSWQLERFNSLWKEIRENVPYFKSLTQQRNLPSEFLSWDEFRKLFPVMDRGIIQSRVKELIDKTEKVNYWSSTGGSTAQPIQIPYSKSELRYARANIWYARSWFGIRPSDKLFLIWGHSHLLGKGLRGKFNGFKRKFKDKLNGYYRYSAYDLSERGLRNAVEALLKFRPAYIISYAVALDRFARVNAELKEKFHKLKLKVAIATAESFSRIDSVSFISDVLGCPVVMEYGAVETGPIAHQRMDGKYFVFWKDYFLEGIESEVFPGKYEILVTTLYPRCLPLIRYKIGDLISENINDENFAQFFNGITGRCNDYILLEDGSAIHSEAFTHTVKDMEAILSYQVVQRKEGRIKFYYTSTRGLDSEELNEIKRKLSRINKELAKIDIERVDGLEQTIAGKTKRIVRIAE